MDKYDSYSDSDNYTPTESSAGGAGDTATDVVESVPEDSTATDAVCSNSHAAYYRRNGGR